MSNLFLNVEALLDDLILVLLSNSANTLEDSAQLTDIEHIMELGRSGKESVLDCGPKGNCGLNEGRSHVDDLGAVSLRVEELLQNFTIDVLYRSLRRKSHIHAEELTLQTMRDIVTTTTWMIHSTKILETFN